MAYSEDGWQLFFRAQVEALGGAASSFVEPTSADRADGIDMLATASAPGGIAAVVVGFSPEGFTGDLAELREVEARAKRAIDRLVARVRVPEGHYECMGHVWNSGGESRVGGQLAERAGAEVTRKAMHALFPQPSHPVDVSDQ